MASNDVLRAAERRVVTALFCDVVGSTALAETMDPEDWADVVNETVSNMAGCIERYDGTVVHFGGDSILAIFGAYRILGTMINTWGLELEEDLANEDHKW